VSVYIAKTKQVMMQKNDVIRELDLRVTRQNI